MNAPPSFHRPLFARSGLAWLPIPVFLVAMVALWVADLRAHKQAEAELRRRAEELRAANEELTRFNRVTVGRELRIIELKKQVNDLCARLNQPPRYKPEPGEEALPAQ